MYGHAHDIRTSERGKTWTTSSVDDAPERWRSRVPSVVTTVAKFAELPPLRQHTKPTKAPVVEGVFEDDVGELLVLLGVLPSNSDAARESARAMLGILF